MHQKRGRRSLINSRVLMAVPAGPARQGAAVLGAGRRGPDHVKVAGREHGHGCTRRRRWWAPPRDQDPSLLPPSPAPRRPGPPTQFPRTAPAIEASSFSKSGWKASQITAANKAQQQASSRLHRARSQSRKRSWSSSSKSRAWLRLRAVGLPHILVGRVFFGRQQEKRGPDRATMELILGEVQTNARGGKFLPLKGNPV